MNTKAEETEEITYRDPKDPLNVMCTAEFYPVIKASSEAMEKLLDVQWTAHDLNITEVKEATDILHKLYMKWMDATMACNLHGGRYGPTSEHCQACQGEEDVHMKVKVSED